MYIERWRFGKNTTGKRIYEDDRPSYSAQTVEGVTTYAVTIRRETGETYEARDDGKLYDVAEHISVHLTSDDLDKLIEMRERQRLHKRETHTSAYAGNDIHFCLDCGDAIHCNVGTSAIPEQLANHGIGRCSERCANCFKVASGQLRGACPGCGNELKRSTL